MTKNVYLSVDVDFWNLDEETVAVKEFRHIIRKIKSLSIPYYICQDHREILRHIKKFPHFNTLINIDAHDDFAEEQCVKTIKDLDCGSWVNFVPQRRNPGSKYIWIGPVGDGIHCGFDNNNYTKPYASGWSKAIERDGSNSLSKLPWNQICGVGFSMSYDYIEQLGLRLIEELHDAFGVTFMNPESKLLQSNVNLGIELLHDLRETGELFRLYTRRVFKHTNKQFMEAAKCRTKSI